jgi:hypothetical protein
VVPCGKGGLGLIALGTDKGTISVWDLTRGVLATKIGEVRLPASSHFRGGCSVAESEGPSSRART